MASPQGKSADTENAARLGTSAGNEPIKARKEAARGIVFVGEDIRLGQSEPESTPIVKARLSRLSALAAKVWGNQTDGDEWLSTLTWNWTASPRRPRLYCCWNPQGRSAPECT